MISEIVLNKKYKVVNARHTRTPLYIHNDYVFYEHDYNGFHECSHCCVEDFERSVEEIPEAPEEWFEVIFQVELGNSKPHKCSVLYKSKSDFLNSTSTKENDYKFIKLRKVEL